MKNTLKLKGKVFILVVFSMIFTLILVYIFLSERDKKIYPSNMAVSNMTLANVKKSNIQNILEKDFPEKNNLVLIIGKDKVELKLKESGIFLDTAATINRINSISHQSSIFTRGKHIKIQPVFNWNEHLLKRAVKLVAISYSKKAINAQLVYKNNGFIQLKPHQKGYYVDHNKALDKIKLALDNGYLGPVKIEVKEVEPAITLADLKPIQDLLAVATWTNVKLNKTDYLVINAIDDIVLMPDDKLNLEEFITARSIDINQTSVLAVLSAVLENVSKQIDLAYNSDTQTIHNNFYTPVLINIEVDKGVLWLSVIGQNNTDKKISIITEKKTIPAPVKYKLDESLAAGEQKIVKGLDTVVVSKYKVVQIKDKIVEKSILSEHTYYGCNTLIYTGPGTINK